VSAQAQKQAWRQRLRAARRAQPAQLRAARGAALAWAVTRLAAQRATGRPVCAYRPVGTEPAWAPGLDLLCAAGHDVLLPVVATRCGPLEWARYEGPGRLTRGPFGLREPAGPRLGVEAIGHALLVLVPALAADRRGVRLGQGAGHYDRSLPLADPAALLVVVLNDEELVDELPAEPHDVRMGVALLAEAGVVSLG